MVSGRVWGVQGGSGGSRGGLIYPCRALFAPLEVFYGTRFGSKGHTMSTRKPFEAPNCPKISLLASEKVMRWPKITRFGTKCKIMRHVGDNHR